MGTTFACFSTDINLPWESETLNILVKTMITLSGECLVATEALTIDTGK